jgi:beta-lactamase class A
VLEPRNPSRRAQRRSPRQLVSPSAQATASPPQEFVRRKPAKPRSGIRGVLLAILGSRAVLGSKQGTSHRELSRRERRQQQRGVSASSTPNVEPLRRTHPPQANDKGRSVIPLESAPSHTATRPVPHPDRTSQRRQRLHSVDRPGSGVDRSGIDRTGADRPRSVDRPFASAEATQPHSSAHPAPTTLHRRPNERSGKRQPNQRQSPKGKAPRSFSVTAFVQGMRLVILGVGVWAIAGTVLSMANPQVRPDQGSYAGAEDGQQDSAYVQGLAPGAANASTSTLIAGQPMNNLLQKVTPITQGLPDLTPGVFVVDLDNGDYMSLNGEATFAAASMIKVPILIAFLQDVDAGKIRLDEKLTMLEGDLAGESGEMQFDGVGTQYTALETAANMIIISDNTATNMLIRQMGGIEVLSQRFRGWGLQQTTLRNLLPDLEGTNETSPRELSNLIARVSEGELLSMKSRDRFFDIMQRTVANGLLPAALGQGATIAHKTGDIGSLLGDSGLVDMPNGKRYAITVMVKRPHNDDRAFEIIRQIAGVTYDHLNQVPATSNTVEPSLPSDESYAGE